MPIKKILVATDFSEGARRAYELAVRLAVRDGAELVLLHAWDIPAYAGYLVAPNVVQSVQENGQALLAEEGARARAAGVRSVATQLAMGVAWQVVVEALAADRTIDLCIVGTHGRTGLSRVLLGSIAEKVVRLAPCPVLAVHPDDAIARFTHVLCPTDFSDPDEMALAMATKLADAPEAAITLAHVVDIPAAALDRGDIITMTRELEAESEAELARRARFGNSSARIATRTEIGVPGATLVDLVQHQQFELVVVASHGRTGARRALLGSVAEKLVRHARCPVLVVRRPS